MLFIASLTELLCIMNLKELFILKQMTILENLKGLSDLILKYRDYDFT